MNLNLVVLAGRATRGPESHQLPDGRTIVSVRMAINSVWKDASGSKHEDVTYITVTSVGTTGRIISDYIRAGSLFLVEGSLHCAVKAAEAEKPRREYWTVRADSVQLGPKAQQDGQDNAAAH